MMKLKQLLTSPKAVQAYKSLVNMLVGGAMGLAIAHLAMSQDRTSMERDRGIPYTIQGEKIYILSEIQEPWKYLGLLIELHTCTGERTLILNSPGGYVATMYMITDAMKTSSCTVNTEVQGTAASAAAVIAIYGKSLTMGENSRLMFHTFSGGYRGKSNEILSEVGSDILAYSTALKSAPQQVLTPGEVTGLLNGQDIYVGAIEVNKRIEDGKKK